jgi:hypothetical protein
MPRTLPALEAALNLPPPSAAMAPEVGLVAMALGAGFLGTVAILAGDRGQARAAPAEGPDRVAWLGCAAALFVTGGLQGVLALALREMRGEGAALGLAAVAAACLLGGLGCAVRGLRGRR